MSDTVVTMRMRAAAVGVVLIVAGGLASCGRGSESASQSEPTPSAIKAAQTPDATTPRSTPTLPTPIAGEATDLVGRFLWLMRSGQLPAAAALWSGYPDPNTEDLAGRTNALNSYKDAHGWLFADRNPSLSVTPSWGFTRAEPVVTVVVDGPGGSRRVGAFVLSEANGHVSIERLPEPAPASTPAQGQMVRPGGRIVLSTTPVEGGALAFINGAEVQAEVDIATRKTTIVVPRTVTGEVILTISLATPEIPGASALWYPPVPDT